MPVTTLGGHQVHVNEEGFLTDPAEWDDELAAVLAQQIGLELTDEHRTVLTFLRDDFAQRGETATLRRAAAGSGVPVKDLFRLFPQKPAKKMAYVAGLPKPVGCV
ncbi:TusE/DsrC/DsvC family sulfur relay protein [Cellulomonas humilata]|uniref:tRNA 2-thiouridine synthesizing protein E n=1 Tax=Cellulomonas humilata TaxID=144055 RepID=A0ABU0EK09_9CELL|nr:TusE/DsrC/DsvC family sulfur relay protein [Cellulomonas humilata]MDQ0375626.1 tRNA 2-thiouridine synthesizing protein E [Cellulomonas humilata]